VVKFQFRISASHTLGMEYFFFFIPISRIRGISHSVAVKSWSSVTVVCTVVS